MPTLKGHQATQESGLIFIERFAQLRRERDLHQMSMLPARSALVSIKSRRAVVLRDAVRLLNCGQTQAEADSHLGLQHAERPGTVP